MTSENSCKSCPCSESGNEKTCLKTRVDEIISKIKELDDPNEKFLQAVDTHEKITTARKETRKIGKCLDYNYDPDYPGRELL